MKIMKVAIPFAKNVLAPLAAAASATDAGIQKNKKKVAWFWSNNFINLK